MKARWSVTARLSVGYLLTSLLMLLGMAASVSWAIHGHFDELDRHTLRDTVQLVRGMAGQTRDVHELQKRLDAALQDRHGLAIRIHDEQGQVVYNTMTMSDPLEWPPVDAHISEMLAWRDEQGEYRGVVAASLPLSVLPVGSRIVAVLDTAHHDHFVSDLYRLLWAYGLVAAGLSGLLGWWATRRGLAPLRVMRDRARGVISARQLDQRLDVDTVPVEFADLALTLNEMWRRLQEDFERLSAFSSDLAHELRTPLNNLLTQTEVVLSRPRQTPVYQETLASSREELQRLSRTVSDMLWLAKADHGLLQLPHPGRIDLAHEVRALFDFYEALAEERGVRLCLQGEAVVTGDRLMLRRAISNLLSNALRHAPTDSEIAVVLSSGSDGNVRLCVSNRGEPIPAAIRARLFDRFFRADKARTHVDSEGAGLGLPITQAIVKAHGGHISVMSEGGHNRFCIDWPTDRSGAYSAADGSSCTS